MDTLQGEVTHVTGSLGLRQGSLLPVAEVPCQATCHYVGSGGLQLQLGTDTGAPHHFAALTGYWLCANYKYLFEGASYFVSFYFATYHEGACGLPAHGRNLALIGGWRPPARAQCSS